MKHSTATLSTGVTLPYVEQGDPSGVPVLMLHGYSDSLTSFEPLLAELPDSVHAYAVTQRGHGDAGKPAGGYGAGDFAADAAAFLDAVGVEAAVVVGHSGGSCYAQRLAIDYPDRVLGVVLIGAFHSFHDNPGALELRDAVAGLTDPVDLEFVREFQESCVADPMPAEFMDRIVANSRRMPARVWKAAIDGLIEAGAPTETGTIAAPTLILWGDRDAFCPRSDQDGLLTAIPEARLRTYPGTGHCPHWEQPERAAAELVSFAATLRAPVAAR
jgi:non-heme chloroperoxidase